MWCVCTHGYSQPSQGIEREGLGCPIPCMQDVQQALALCLQGASPTPSQQDAGSVDIIKCLPQKGLPL